MCLHIFAPCQQNTFQAILITDGLSSITIFTYKCGLLEWDNGVTIGYNAAGDPYDNYDPSSSDIACENDPNSDWNNVVYVLSENDPDVTIGETLSVSYSVIYILMLPQMKQLHQMLGHLPRKYLGLCHSFLSNLSLSCIMERIKSL